MVIGKEGSALQMVPSRVEQVRLTASQRGLNQSGECRVPCLLTLTFTHCLVITLLAVALPASRVQKVLFSLPIPLPRLRSR